jgi:TetR/AcrR family transcriptional regulator, transcriptional repressor of bet genes
LRRRDLIDATIRLAAHSAGDDRAARLHALIAASFTHPGFTAEHVAV